MSRAEIFSTTIRDKETAEQIVAYANKLGMDKAKFVRYCIENTMGIDLGDSVRHRKVSKSTIGWSEERSRHIANNYDLYSDEVKKRYGIHRQLKAIH